MTKLNKFLGDDTGAVTIDWVALTAGILLLGIIVIYAIFNGGVANLVGDINATLAGLTADVDAGPAPDLHGIEVASGGGPMELVFGLSAPVGSKVVESGFGFATIQAPDGSFFSDGVTTVINIGTNNNVNLGVGTEVSSATTFTQPDGTIIQVADVGII